MIGPQRLGAELLAMLTTAELGVLRTHLTSGWYKQAVVYPAAVDNGLWRTLWPCSMTCIAPSG